MEIWAIRMKSILFVSSFVNSGASIRPYREPRNEGPAPRHQRRIYLVQAGPRPAREMPWSGYRESVVHLLHGESGTPALAQTESLGTEARGLRKHIGLCTTLFPDEETCLHWVDVVSESRLVGRPLTTADAWIAATARQWDLPLVTTDHRDFQHIRGLTLVPVM